MKRLMFIVAATLCMVACNDEKIDWGTQGNLQDGVGYIAFAEGGLSVNVDNESAAGDVEPKATRAITEAGDDYMVEIWNQAGEMVTSFKYGQREANYTTSPYDSSRKGIAVAAGTYTVKAYSAETPKESNTPNYAGEAVVEVGKEQVANAEVVCTLSSVKVSVRFDPILASLITDATQSRVVLGSQNVSEYTFTGRPVTPAAEDSAVLEGLSKMAWDAEGGSRYLRPNEDVNPLTLYLTTTYNGSAIKDQALNVVNNAKPGEWRKITVKLENGDSGTVYFNITVQTLVDGEEVDCDVTSVAVDMIEAGIPDDTDAPVIEWADHDLAAPFMLTDAMFSEAGDFTAGAAFSVKTKFDIASFKLAINTTNSDLATTVEEIGLSQEGGLELTSGLSTTAKIILGSWGFPVSNVGGVTEVNFDLSPLMKVLHFDYAGAHTLTFAVADNKGGVTEQQIAITSGIVLDPNIEWVGYDISKRYDIRKDDNNTMKIQVTAKNGIKSLEVTIDGALSAVNDKTGTSLLDDVKMPSSFDLVNPGQNLSGGDLAVNLTGLGFPTGDDVKDKTQLSFDITSFKSMLVVAAGHNDFKLKLTDNEGNVVEKSMMINMIVE